jgi:hypothetical protein
MKLPPSPFCEIAPGDARPAAECPAPSVAESFSELTARRSLKIVSPPLPVVVRKIEVDLDALEDEIVPRPPRERRKLADCVHSMVRVAPDDETEPLPLCLRAPRPEFVEAIGRRQRYPSNPAVKSLIRTLLELGGEL